MNSRNEALTALLKLSHELGRPSQAMAILGEGNASTRLTPDTFLVKASGTNLAGLREEDVVECRVEFLLALLDQGSVTDAEVREALMESRVNSSAKMPSVESIFHAWLLTLPGVEFVGHTHPISINSILCSPRAREFAERRIFPDEIVCCDVESVFVPYSDPGLSLARNIRERTQAFMQKHQRAPRVILLQNHGIITVGRSIEAVLAAMLMAEKAATIWLGAASLGGPKFLQTEDVARIAIRPDEELRKRILNI